MRAVHGSFGSLFLHARPFLLVQRKVGRICTSHAGKCLVKDIFTEGGGKGGARGCRPPDVITQGGYTYGEALSLLAQVDWKFTALSRRQPHTSGFDGLFVMVFNGVFLRFPVLLFVCTLSTPFLWLRQGRELTSRKTHPVDGQACPFPAGWRDDGR